MRFICAAIEIWIGFLIGTFYAGISFEHKRRRILFPTIESQLFSFSFAGVHFDLYLFNELLIALSFQRLPTLPTKNT